MSERWLRQRYGDPEEDQWQDEQAWFSELQSDLTQLEQGFFSGPRHYVTAGMLESVITRLKGMKDSLKRTPATGGDTSD